MHFDFPRFQSHDTVTVTTLGVMAALSISICDVDTLRWPDVELGFQKCFSQYPTLSRRMHTGASHSQGAGICA